MSISTMTNLAFARRVDVPPLGTAPANMGEVEQAAGGTPESRSAMTSTISAITRYIPTEVLTLYVAALGAVGSNTDPQKVTHAEWIAFGFFLLATPLVVWLLYAAKVLNSNSGISATDNKKVLPLDPRKWPVWEMFAATLGYAAWAFALPNSPFRDFADFYSQALGGVIVLVVSTILGLIAPVVCGTLPK